VTDRSDDPRLLKRVEIATAVLLSVAGLISAWASYQASLWGGVQAESYARANTKLTEASRLSVVEGQLVGMDSMLFMAWIDAAADNDEQRMTFFERRFSPEMKDRFVPWRGKNPGDLRLLKPNLNAPTSFPRPIHQEAVAARALQAASEKDLAKGDAANQVSDRYVAATVVLSIVLFLGGISPLLQSTSVRTAMLGLAALLGLAASIFIFSLPMQAL
jgi:hypothetical protein